MKFHCHCNIPEYQKIAQYFNFLIGMFMYNINLSKKNVREKVIINIYSKMYQMTLFIKKVIYKKMIIINTH